MTNFWQTVACIALALQLASVLAAYFAWVEVYRFRRETGRASRKLALQMRNLIGMLLKAGFKCPPVGRDWNDDFRETSVLGQHTDTKWDWHTPD